MPKKPSDTKAAPTKSLRLDARTSAPAAKGVEGAAAKPDPREIWAHRIARQPIQALKPYAPGKSIEEVQAKYRPETITKLGSNENPLGASPKVIAAIRDAAAKSSLYPDGASQRLRGALAARHGLSPDQIMVGNGSDEILLMIAAAFLNPGEPVLVSEHTFSEYEFSGRVFDGHILKIPLKDYRYHLPAFAKALSARPKLVFLCNPNNPTGSYFTHAELLSFLRKASPDTLVVVDEAYGEYATAPDFPRTLSLMPAYPNLIVCRTFSKIFGMAGLRVGTAFAHPLVIREMSRVKTPFNVNLLAQAGALAALSDATFVRKSLRTNQAGLAYLEKEMRRLDLEFIPTQANFLCFRTQRPAVDLGEDLLKQGMIIRALRSFGLEHWSRVTIGMPAQNRRFIRLLETVLRA